MADTDNLRTASLYINNQLLSRGLLRDGSTIDFADPMSGGDLGDTMSRIMGVVNDLILRRDRDAEHREALSQTLRTLRAENLHQTNHLQRECDAHADAQRRLQTAEAASQAQRAQLSQAESTIHKLKDEAARTKALVAQTRGACANEVRKRDRQIDALKKAVLDAGRARGERRGTTVTSITVTGEMGGDGGEVQSAAGLEQGATACDDYDLRQESNSFLAELAKGLSADNEALMTLVRRVESNLKEMSGYEGSPTTESQNAQASLLPGAVEELETELEAVLQHLRTILTNPSFVPIEEVVVRDEEIHRLREGWEKMETRWKEAVHLIDGWRRRMASSGKSVNMEELKMGLRLSPVRVRHVAETSQGLGLRVAPINFNLRSVQEEEEDDEELKEEQREEKSTVHMIPSPAESLHLVPAPGYEDLADDDDNDDDDSDSESSIFEDEVDIHDLDVSEPNVQILEQSMMMESLDSSPLPEPPQLSPLKDSETAGNRRRPEPSRSRKRPGEFSAITEENTYDSASAVEEAPPKPPARVAKKAEPRQRQTAAAPRAKPQEMPSRPNSAASYASTTSTTTEKSIKLVKSDTSAPTSGTKAAQPPPAKKRNTAKTAEPQPSSRRPARPATSMATTRPTRAAAAAANRAVTTNRETRTHAPSKSLPEQHIQETTSTQPKRGAAAKEMPPPPVPTRATRQTAATPSKLAIVVPPPSSSRLPLPRTANANGVPQSPLTMATIQAKLAASERDADAARVRAKLKAARLGRGGLGAAAAAGAAAAPSRTASNGTTKSADDSEQGGASVRSIDSIEPIKRAATGGARSPLSELTVSGGSEDKGSSTGSTVRVVVDKPQDLSPRKRGRRAEKVASRRRSTLNAWELKTLISGDVAVSPSRGS
ncbi:hypothetical protein PspLS_03522 [Pyricularia sp. CBS 133598]|nr:hypothetical protein PspLS_03522 [Pyricularia sp. CBS 133598]